jgi:hypothetical protein
VNTIADETNTNPPERNNEVTAVLTSGYEYSGCGLVHRILLDAGLAQAMPSRREQLSAMELQAKLLKSMGASAGGAVVALQPGRLWNELAVDLFLGNLEVPAWGWSDTSTMPLLDFWHEFDVNTRFVLVYSPLEFAIGQALQGKKVTRDALESVTARWTAHGEAIVRFMKRHQGRCEVVNVVGALHSPAQLIRRLAQRWSLPLQLAADYIPDRKGLSMVAASLARGAVRDRDDVSALYSEMEVLAGLDDAAPTVEEELLAWNEYSDERTTHAATVMQVAQLEQRLTDAASSARELQAAVDQANRQLEQLGHERDARTALLAERSAQLEGIQQKYASACAKLEELQRDSDLLRQVQDELGQNRKQLEEVTHERDAQTALLAERSAELDGIQQKYASACAKLEELQRDRDLLRQVQGELEQQRKQIEDLTHERDTQTALLTERSAQLDRTEQQYASARAKLEDLQQDSELLRLVQVELDQNKSELRQLTREQDNQTKLLAERSAQVHLLDQQLEAAQKSLHASSSADALKVKDFQRENELLLLHLHQVQEELEHYYIQHQDLLAKSGRDSNLIRFLKDNQPSEVIVDLRRDFDGENWYHAEDDGRWAGPKTMSSVRIPALVAGQYVMELDVVDAMSPEIVANMEVHLNGTPIATDVHLQSDYPALVLGRFSTDTIPPETHWCFELRFKNVMSPLQRGESDDRMLAVRARSLTLILEEPANTLQ